jgi:hypothetical protein
MLFCFIVILLSVVKCGILSWSILSTSPSLLTMSTPTTIISLSLSNEVPFTSGNGVELVGRDWYFLVKAHYFVQLL